MSAHRASIRDALNALRLHADGGISWLGERIEGPVSAARENLPLGVVRDLLAHRVTHRLYVDFFTQGSAVISIDRRNAPSSFGRADLVDALSSANSGTGARQSGWELRSRNGENVVIERAGITVLSDARDYADGVLLLPKELRERSPGHYTALGNTLPGSDDLLRRVYWNLTPAGSVEAMAAITASFNDALIPFTFKVLNDSTAFIRCDAGVLYVRRKDLPVALPIVQSLATRLASGVNEAVPAMTRRIAAGVADADDPAGESFGLHRCRLIADGALDAWQRGTEGLAERMHAVEARFTAAGIRIDQPHEGHGQ
jgi:HopA1 effector protein family